VKLPPQVAAVARRAGAGLSRTPAARGVIPLKQPAGTLLEGLPDAGFVSGGASKVRYIYCSRGHYWSYCPGTQGYECCPVGQQCRQVGNDWACA
jgi:hypothetical protein